MPDESPTRSRSGPWVPPEPLPVPLEGERVLLDWLRESDAAALHRVIHTHRAALSPWLPWARNDHEDEEASLGRIRANAHTRSETHADDFPIGVFLRGSEREILGSTGLHRIHAESARAEVGYWIRPDRQRQGLATEAVALLVTSAFADWGLRRILVECDADNHASVAVAKKLGLRLEAHRREASWREGTGWVDELSFAVLAREWDAVRRRGPLHWDR